MQVTKTPTSQLPVNIYRSVKFDAPISARLIKISGKYDVTVVGAMVIAVPNCKFSPSQVMFLVHRCDNYNQIDEQWYHNDCVVFDNQSDFDAAYSF